MSKIYTRTGDEGYTSLIGGTRVPKHHLRIESYGTIDELNSFIGLIRDNINDEHTRQILIDIQNNLFTAGSQLAVEPDVSKHKYNVQMHALVGDNHIVQLEHEMDAMNEHIPPMRAFVLPGGNSLISYCHISRTVCRRAERIILRLAEDNEVSPAILMYLNRLSDYLFVLARHLSHTMNVEEISWTSHK